MLKFIGGYYGEFAIDIGKWNSLESGNKVLVITKVPYAMWIAVVYVHSYLITMNVSLTATWKFNSISKILEILESLLITVVWPIVAVWQYIHFKNTNNVLKELDEKTDAFLSTSSSVKLTIFAIGVLLWLILYTCHGVVYILHITEDQISDNYYTDITNRSNYRWFIIAVVIQRNSLTITYLFHWLTVMEALDLATAFEDLSRTLDTSVSPDKGQAIQTSTALRSWCETYIMVKEFSIRLNNSVSYPMF